MEVLRGADGVEDAVGVAALGGGEDGEGAVGDGFGEAQNAGGGAEMHCAGGLFGVVRFGKWEMRFEVCVGVWRFGGDLGTRRHLCQGARRGRAFDMDGTMGAVQEDISILEFGFIGIVNLFVMD